MTKTLPRSALADPVVRGLIVDYVRRLLPAIPPGVHLESWHRTWDENVAAKGKPESQHLLGLATDWTGTEKALDTLAIRARRQGLHPFKGVSPRTGTRLLHVQRFPAGALRQLGLI